MVTGLRSYMDKLPDVIATRWLLFHHACGRQGRCPCRPALLRLRARVSAQASFAMFSGQGRYMHPYYQTYIHSIEMVQHRAARFVMNKYSNYNSVSQILDTLGLNTLDDRCNKLRAVMVYKIIHNLVDIEPCNYLTPSQLPTRGHHHRFQQLPTYIDSYKYSFYPDTVRIGLPEHIVKATTLQLFKEGLHLI